MRQISDRRDLPIGVFDQEWAAYRYSGGDGGSSGERFFLWGHRQRSYGENRDRFNRLRAEN